MHDWKPNSWQKKTAAQQPLYDNHEELRTVVGELSARPPLVTSWEVERLRNQLAIAAKGKAFLLQGGDCSESFQACHADPIAKKLKVLLQMSLVLVYGMNKPIIRIGRIAGQYAKPRSSDYETRDGVTLPSYRGDCVNRIPFTEEDRKNRPELLLEAYSRSAQTLNYLRALAEGGFADIHHPENWDLDFVTQSKKSQQYHQLVAGISDSLRFIETIGGVASGNLSRVDFYTSHEALLLPYEQALTRQPISGGGWYNLGTHYPWIGDRTRAIDGAHIEYFRGIENPIGLKVGPTASATELTDLIRLLNPERQAGRLTLICRFGAHRIKDCLPPLIEAVQKEKYPVLWSIDPMHGNTMTTDSGFKTRHFDQILSEVRDSFSIHQQQGSVVGGIHLELTGNDVTECIGGTGGLQSADLKKAYESAVDPRLNYEQAMEIAFLIAGQARQPN